MDLYNTYTIYNPPDVHWHILNNTMSQYYLCFYHIFGLNGVWNHQLPLSCIQYQDPPTIDCIKQEMSVFYSWQGNNIYTTNNVRLIHLVETTNSSFLSPNIRTLLLSTAYYKCWQDVSELELLFILFVWNHHLLLSSTKYQDPPAVSVLYICLKPPTPPFFHKI